MNYSVSVREAEEQNQQEIEVNMYPRVQGNLLQGTGLCTYAVVGAT